MIPSRGIVRSLPVRGAWRQLPKETLHPRSRGQLGNGRSFGTALCTSRSGLTTAPLLRSRHIATPAILAGVQSSRSLSLWGYGSKQTSPVEEPIPVPPTPIEEIVQPPGPVLTETAAAPPGPETPASLSTPPTDDFSSIVDLVSGQDVLNMPETLGYLRAIGLDYGIGPTSVMQWVLEHVHVWGGLSWGGAIIASAFILRLVMLYPQVQGLKFGAKAGKMKEDPRSKEAIDLIKRGFAEKDQQLTQKGQFMQKALSKEYDVNMFHVVWNFLPIPFSFGLFRLIQGMTHIPVPSLETSGFLWFTDLTVRDPYFLLPAAAAGMMTLSVLVNKSTMTAQQQKMMSTLMPVIGVVGCLFTAWLSAGVNLMGFSFGAATFLTTLVTRNGAFRRATGLPPLPEVAPPVTKATYEAPRQAGSLRERMTESLGEAKKSFNSQISTYTGGAGGASDMEKAEKKRREMLEKLENTRKEQAREEWERRHKHRQ